jgi:signal transduction histidine kinase
VDLNFLSVLICGVTTLIALKAVVTSIWKDLDAQNKNHIANELKVKVEKMNGQIDHYEEIVKEGKTELIELEKELEILNVNQRQAQTKLKEEKIQLDSNVENLIQSKEKEKDYLTKLSDLYNARVENENLMFDHCVNLCWFFVNDFRI